MGQVSHGAVTSGSGPARCYAALSSSSRIALKTVRSRGRRPAQRLLPAGGETPSAEAVLAQVQDASLGHPRDLIGVLVAGPLLAQMLTGRWGDQTASSGSTTAAAHPPDLPQTRTPSAHRTTDS